jgi:hypothetical protein
MQWLKNRKIKKIRNAFSLIEQMNSLWSCVIWNLDLDKLENRNYSLELNSSEGRHLFKCHKIEKNFFSFQASSSKINLNLVLSSLEAQELKSLFNLSLHHTLLNSIEFHKSDILLPVTGATTQHLKDEARALEWIKTSFKVLSASLEKIQTDENLILTAGLFSGIEPKTQKKLLRLIVMNLDMSFYFEEDSSLRVVIYNDKDTGHGSSGAPVFNQIIKVTKPQFYDEIIKIINKVSLVGDFSC